MVAITSPHCKLLDDNGSSGLCFILFCQKGTIQSHRAVCTIAYGGAKECVTHDRVNQQIVRILNLLYR